MTSVVINPYFDWGYDRPPNGDYHDSVIYEAHVKGMSRLHPGVPEELRGTYAGMAEPAIVDHLTSLRVTAVELMPVHQFVNDPHLVAQGLSNYWGYNTIGFFASHNGYAAYGTRGELGAGVQDAHQGVACGRHRHDSRRGPHVGHQFFVVSGQRDRAVHAARVRTTATAPLTADATTETPSPTPTSNGSGLRDRTTEIHRMNAAATKIMMPSLAAEVLGPVAKSRSSAQIADALAVSVKTHANYLSAFLSSLHAATGRTSQSWSTGGLQDLHSRPPPADRPR